jgi:hypothetical protein
MKRCWEVVTMRDLYVMRRGGTIPGTTQAARDLDSRGGAHLPKAFPECLLYKLATSNFHQSKPAVSPRARVAIQLSGIFGCLKDTPLRFHHHTTPLIHEAGLYLLSMDSTVRASIVAAQICLLAH